MSKAKILVVDDDPDVVEQVSLVLDSGGYEVVSAGGVEEAEQALLSFRPDAAVLDLMMEQQDSGFVLCHEIKRLYPDTPVILLTSVKAATGMSFEPASAEQAGWVKAEKILDKPVRPEQLLREVEAQLVRTGKLSHPAGKGH
ncbi:MAG TPA: response regulator [Planctomycetota bacterium]|nr:response regulator [Planctomycetota bacterium]